MRLQELEEQAGQNLRNRTDFIPQAEQTLSASRKRYLQGLKEISPSGIPIEESVRPFVSNLEQSSAENLRSEKFRLNQEKFGDIFNFSLQNYLNAGYDRDQAEQYARQFALDTMERKFISGQAEDERNQLLEKHKITETAQNRLNILLRDIGDDRRRAAMKMAVISGLSQFGAQLVTAGIIKGGGALAGSSTATLSGMASIRKK